MYFFKNRIRTRTKTNMIWVPSPNSRVLMRKKLIISNFKCQKLKSTRVSQIKVKKKGFVHLTVFYNIVKMRLKVPNHAFEFVSVIKTKHLRTLYIKSRPKTPQKKVLCREGKTKREHRKILKILFADYLLLDTIKNYFFFLAR